MISASDPLAWRPRTRREPDLREGELSADERRNGAKIYPGRVPGAETVPGFRGDHEGLKLQEEVRNFELEAALSRERFSRYVDRADSDRDRASELYTLNARLSESPYISLHMLEVVLRNRIHTVTTEAHGEDWFQHQEFILGARQGEQQSRRSRTFEARVGNPRRAGSWRR